MDEWLLFPYEDPSEDESSFEMDDIDEVRDTLSQKNLELEKRQRDQINQKQLQDCKQKFYRC